MSKTVAPAIDRRSFTCPHCGAHTGQQWRMIYAKSVDDQPPHLIDEAEFDVIAAHLGHNDQLFKRVVSRRTFSDLYVVRVGMESGEYVPFAVLNLFISQCDICGDIALWHRDRLFYPPLRHDVEPNSDLSAEIQADFNEARTVLDLSPRSATALLRLCIQKLCVQLGLPGDNLNNDIGTLVSRGLDPRVQRALDLVRVIGNNAVHPGVIDLKDDRPTAARLFQLVNSIAHETLTRPRELDSLYEAKVPESQKKAIAKRDGK